MNPTGMHSCCIVLFVRQMYWLFICDCDCKNQIIAGPTIKDFVRMGLHADLSIDAHIVTHQTMHFQIALKQKKLM